MNEQGALMLLNKKVSMLFSLLVLAMPFWSMGALGAMADSVTLDVRTTEEFEESHLKGAQNIDFLKNDFSDRVEKLDKKRTYKVYCRSGNRSGKALEIMKKLGFTNVENVGSLEQAKNKLKAECEGRKPC